MEWDCEGLPWIQGPLNFNKLFFFARDDVNDHEIFQVVHEKDWVKLSFLCLFALFLILALWSVKHIFALASWSLLCISRAAEVKHLYSAVWQIVSCWGTRSIQIHNVKLRLKNNHPEELKPINSSLKSQPSWSKNCWSPTLPVPGRQVWCQSGQSVALIS